MEKLITCLYIIVVISGCAGQPTQEQLYTIGTDFQRLFEIGYKLADPNDVQVNQEGLEMFLSPEQTAHIVDLYTWILAIKRGIQAGEALQEGYTPRDMHVQKIMWYYQQGSLP